jgi:hypothetical protein
MNEEKKESNHLSSLLWKGYIIILNITEIHIRLNKKNCVGSCSSEDDGMAY